jgi:hypothetical protein
MGVMVASGAWNEPTSSPPNGNVAAPINVGSNNQVKTGTLILNPGSAVPTLGIFSGGHLDISGLIRIVNPNGSLKTNGEGTEGQILARTATGMQWFTPPFIPECTVIAKTGVFTEDKISIPVPPSCLDQTCNLILATREASQKVNDIHATTYFQLTKLAKGSDSVDILNWWVKPGNGADGVDGCGRGRNGTTQGCDQILRDGDNLFLFDDKSSVETDPLRWTLWDNSSTHGLELSVCN